MKRFVVGVSISLILLTLGIPNAIAQEFDNRKTIIVPQHKVIQNDYFAAGEAVTISGTVVGDTYIAAGTVLVDGTIQGDILVAGGTVKIRGPVSGNIRVVGGDITISSKIDGNVTVVAGNVEVSDTARIAGSMVVAGGNLDVFAPIGRGITVGVGNMLLSSTVGGDILAGVDHMTFTPQTNVSGNITYWSENILEVPTGATISGQLIHNTLPTKPDTKNVKQAFGMAFAGFALAVKTIEMLMALTLGVIVMKMAPKYTEETIDLMEERPWYLALIGLITFIVLPVLVIMSMLTIIGIPIGLFGVAIMGIIYFFAKIFAALFIGMKALSLVTKRVNMYAALLMGLIILFTLLFIPLVGWLIAFVLVLMGLGALIIQKKRFYTSLRAKNLI